MISEDSFFITCPKGTKIALGQKLEFSTRDNEKNPFKTNPFKGAIVSLSNRKGDFVDGEIRVGNQNYEGSFILTKEGFRGLLSTKPKEAGFSINFGPLREVLQEGLSVTFQTEKGKIVGRIVKIVFEKFKNKDVANIYLRRVDGTAYRVRYQLNTRKGSMYRICT